MANWVAPRNIRFAMNRLLLAANLTAGGLKVGIAACWRANGLTGKCQWGYRHLGREAGLSRDGYTRALKDLEASGLCEIVRPQTAGQAPAEFLWRWDLARAFMEVSAVPGADPDAVDFLPVPPSAKKRTVTKNSNRHGKNGQSENTPLTIRLSDEGQSDFRHRGYPDSSGTKPQDKHREKPREEGTQVTGTVDALSEVVPFNWFERQGFSEDDLKSACNLVCDETAYSGWQASVCRALGIKDDRFRNWRLGKKRVVLTNQQFARIAADAHVKSALRRLAADAER